MKRIPVPKIEGSHCFACGILNPQGLNMSFYLLGDSVRSDISLNGILVDGEGNRFAEAHAQMAFLSSKRLPMISPQYRSEMESIFAQVQALMAQDHS